MCVAASAEHPHRSFSCGGYLLFCPLFGIMLGIPERIFARLMDGFVLVEKSLSSPLTGRRGQKRFTI